MAQFVQSRVMKADDARASTANVAFNFDDLRAKSDAYLATVREQAKELMAATVAEAEQLRQSAFQSAREEGFRAGLADAEAQIRTQAEKVASSAIQTRLATVVPALQQAIEQLGVERDQWLMRWEQASIDLCLTIVRKIIRQKLPELPQHLNTVVREALQLAAGSPSIRVRLHPEDLNDLQAVSSEFTSRPGAIADTTLVADGNIARGGCRIETEHGVVDATLETQLQRIADELSPGLIAS